MGLLIFQAHRCAVKFKNKILLLPLFGYSYFSSNLKRNTVSYESCVLLCCFIHWLELQNILYSQQHGGGGGGGRERKIKLSPKGETASLSLNSNSSSKFGTKRGKRTTNKKDQQEHTLSLFNRLQIIDNINRTKKTLFCLAYVISQSVRHPKNLFSTFAWRLTNSTDSSETYSHIPLIMELHEICHPGLN